MTRRVVLFIITLSLLLFVYGCGGERAAYPTAPPNTVRIVSSFPTKGLQAAESKLMREAIDLAVEQNLHPLPSWTAQHLALDGGDPESGEWSRSAEERNADAAAEDPSVVAYIGPYASGATGVSLPLTNKAGLLQLGPTATWPGLTLAGWDPGEPGKYYPSGAHTYARLIPNDSLQSTAAAMWAHDEGARRMAILSDGSSYSDGLAREFAAVAAGQEISVTARLALDKSSAGTVRSALEEDRPDAVFFAPSDVGSAALLTEALQGVQLNSGVFLTDVALSSQLMEQVGPDLPGWHFLSNSDPDATASQPAFAGAFKARYGQAPSQYALNAWLFATGTLRAVTSTGGTDRKQIAGSVLTAGNDTCRACPRFTSAGDPVSWRMSGYLLKGGQFQLSWHGGSRQ